MNGRASPGNLLARVVASAVVAGAVILAAGCGGEWGARVSGRVTLDAAVLERGTVQFRPVAGGPAAYGSIGPGGRFTLTVGSGRGPVPPGRYIATVVAVTDPAGGSHAAAAEAIPSPITPPRDGDVKTSGLEFEFVMGRNDVTLGLVSKPPAGEGP